MEALQQGWERFIETVVEWLPQLIGALVIVVIGHWIAKALSRVVNNGLTNKNVRLDERLRSGQGGNVIQRAIPSPTYLLDRVTYWLVFVGAVALGASVLGLEPITDLVAAVYGFVPQVLAALLIFLVGSAIAAGVTTLVRNTMGHTATGKLLETVLPVVVIGITVFAILDQLGIAPTIVTITYAAIIGSVALSSALAFGLGGRDVAAKMLEATYEKGRESVSQAKRDARAGKRRR